MVGAVQARRRILAVRKTLETMATPKIVYLYVTNRCNLRCSHCFYADELNNTAKAELTLDQIERIFSSMHDPLSRLVLTGGEPLLRKDLGDLIQVVARTNRTLSFWINTNGFYPDRTVEVVRQVKAALPGQTLKVAVSFDGTEKVHNAIRRNPHSFQLAVETVERVRALMKEHANLTFRINTAVSTRNADDLEALFNFTHSNFGDFPALQVVRGSSTSVFNGPKDLALSAFDPEKEDLVTAREEIELLHRRIGDVIRKYREKGIRAVGPASQLKLRYQLETLLHGTKKVDCVAGKFDGIIYEDGSVAVCENLKAVSNLADFDHDFHRLWNEKAMRSRVNGLRCWCVHTCNLSTSMTHDLKSQNKIQQARKGDLDPFLGPLDE